MNPSITITWDNDTAEIKIACNKRFSSFAWSTRADLIKDAIIHLEIEKQIHLAEPIVNAIKKANRLL